MKPFSCAFTLLLEVCRYLIFLIFFREWSFIAAPETQIFSFCRNDDFISVLSLQMKVISHQLLCFAWREVTEKNDTVTLLQLQIIEQPHISFFILQLKCKMALNKRNYYPEPFTGRIRKNNNMCKGLYHSALLISHEDLWISKT